MESRRAQKVQEAESLTEVTSSNWVANHLCYKWGKGSMVSSATGSTAQADTAPTGGYITWVGGRVSAAYCQLVGMLTPGDTEARVQSLT